MSEPQDYVPLFTYRGAVEPSKVMIDVTSDEDEEVPAPITLITKKRIKPSNSRPSKKEHNKKRIVISDNKSLPERPKPIEILENSDDEDAISILNKLPPMFAPKSYATNDFQSLERFNVFSESRLLLESLRRQSESPVKTPVRGDSSLVLQLVATNWGPTLKFKVLQNEPLNKALRAYISHAKMNGIIEPNTLTVKQYGLPLDASKTPQELELFSGDILHLFQPRNEFQENKGEDEGLPYLPSLRELIPTAHVVEPMMKAAMNSVLPERSNQDDDEEEIVVKLRYKETTHKFRLKKNEPISKLRDGFCKKTNLKQQDVDLVFDGLTLKGNQSLEDADLQDDDLIDVKLKS